MIQEKFRPEVAPWLRRIVAGLSPRRSGFHKSPCETCGGQSGKGTGVSPITSVFSCQYHSTNAPYTSSSASCSCQKDKGANPENVPKSNACSQIEEHWIQKQFHFLFSLQNVDGDFGIDSTCLYIAFEGNQ
jgi:hypothetical protein